MNVENTGEPPVRKAAILGRLFTYLLKYKFRMFAGILLSLLVSITNLFTISAFYPIFNLLGQEGPVEIIEVGGTEKARLVQASEGRQFAFYERIALQITQWKMSINGLAKGRSSNEVIMLICLIVLPIYLLKLLCVTGTIYFMGTAGLMAVRDIRLELYKKINYLGFDYYGKERSGLILSRIVNDVELVGKAISTEFTDGVINLFYIITHLMFLAAIDWGMLLIALVVVPVLLAPVSKFAVRVRKAAAG